MEIDVQLAAGLFNHVRRGPAVLAGYGIDDAVQLAAAAHVDHRLGQIHFKANFVGKEHARLALMAALYVGVV